MKTRSVMLACGLALSVAGVSLADETRTIRETYTAPNGDTFTAVKTIGDGSKRMSYERAGVIYTPEQLKAYIASHPVPVADASLLNAARANPGAMFDITILHKNRPGSRIARELYGKIQPQLDAIVEETAQIRRTILPNAPMDPQAEKDFLGRVGPMPKLLPQQQQRIRDLAQLHETLTAQVRADMRNRITQAQANDQAAIDQRVKALGGQIASVILSVNGVEATVPGAAIAALVADPMIARIYPKPVGTPELNIQKTSLGLTTGFWANSIDGGIWDVGIIDTGVQQDHPNFSGKTFQEAPGTPITDTDTDPSFGHGTACCGILCNNNATNTGVALGSTLVDVGLFTDVQADADWMGVTAPSDTDPEIINLSGGFPTSPATDVDYNDLEKFFDGFTQDQFCILTKSAGNQGDGTTTITHPAGAYNCLAVANMNDFDSTSRTGDVITSSSSRGPTLGGRFKPDISAPGNNTTTCNRDWATEADFVTNFGGTSSASPHVGGGVLLLVDLRSNDNPYANKAILINTSDTWTDNATSTTTDDGAVSGSQWNKVYGWGYLDLGEAYINGTDVFASTVDDGVTPAGPDFKLYKGQMFNNEKATLVWQRHVGYNGSNVPTAIETFTDLDLLCYRAGTGVLIDSGTSVIQNVEQVVVSATEDVVLKVECFTSNIDPDVGIESFALATEEGFVAANPPAFGGGPVGSDVSPGQTFTFAYQVTNTGGVPAHNVNANLTLPAGYTLVSGTDPQNLGTIADGGAAIATWRVTAPCNTVAATIDVDISSSSYGETFTGSGSEIVTPGVLALVSNVPVVDSDIEKTFSFSMIAQSSGGDWYAVAMAPGAADHDIYADNDQCITSPYQTSTFVGTTKDFIMSNSHIYGAAGAVTHYALATFGADGAYFVEMNASDDLVAGTGTSSRTDSFAIGEVVDCTEILGMAIGRRYFITVDVTSGTCDPSLWGYLPSRSDGDRGNPNFSRNAGGPGVDETLYTGRLTESGFYGFAIINENLAAGNYTFSVTPVCVADVDDGNGNGIPDGGVGIEDLLYYLDLYDAGVIGADVDNGTGTGTPDGGVGIEDLLYFLERYDAGC